MSDGKWPRPVNGPTRTANVEYVREFVATAHRLQEERRIAQPTVFDLLRDVPRERWSLLAAHPDLHTCDALGCLGDIVTKALTNDPSYAQNAAALAVRAAKALPENLYPRVIVAQVRAHAWKDLGKTLRYLARYEESIDALIAAQVVLAPFPALAHDRAIVRFHLAATLQECDRHYESLPILAECKEVFRAYGDTHLLFLCTMSEGVLLQRLGQFREAREKHLLLLASSADIRKDSLAALHHAIGFCSIELGDFAEAENSLLSAIQLYREIGESIHEVKAELGRGRLFLRQGRLKQAFAHLRVVRRDLLRHSLTEEAGLCGLNMVESLLMLDRPEEAEALARKIVYEFTAASLNTRAITALGHLTEAIAARRATAQMINNIHEYVVSLRSKPERDFEESEKNEQR